MLTLSASVQLSTTEGGPWAMGHGLWAYACGLMHAHSVSPGLPIIGQVRYECARNRTPPPRIAHVYTCIDHRRNHQDGPPVQPALRASFHTSTAIDTTAPPPVPQSHLSYCRLRRECRPTGLAPVGCSFFRNTSAASCNAAPNASLAAARELPRARCVHWPANAASCLRIICTIIKDFLGLRCLHFKKSNSQILLFASLRRRRVFRNIPTQLCQGLQLSYHHIDGLIATPCHSNRNIINNTRFLCMVSAKLIYPPVQHIMLLQVHTSTLCHLS